MAEHRTAGDTAPDDEIMPAEGEERVLELADMDYASAARVAAELDRVRSEVAALRDAVQVAAARHTADARLGYDDVRCASCSDEAWPCPTATALDAWRSAAGGES